MPLCLFFQNVFFCKKKKKKHLESFLDCLHIVWALHYIHIAVEVTMNMAILVVVVNLEPIIIGLKNDNVDWDQV